MALQRGSNVRMASDVSDADIMGLVQQQQTPAATSAPTPLDTSFNPVGFDWSQGAQLINGTIYQPIFDDQGSVQSIYKYRQGQIGAGQPYEALDPNTGQKTGEGQFQETGGFGKILRTAAQDLGPLALAAMGVNPGLAAGLGGATASALGIPVASAAGGAGLTAAQVAALGSGVGATGIGLAQGQSLGEALKTGITTGAGGLFSGVGGDLLPSTGNAAVDSALKNAIASGVKAKVSGTSVEDAVVGSLVSAGVAGATGIDLKTVQNAVKAIQTGGDPQQIFNTVVSAAQGGLIPGAEPPGRATAVTPSLPAYQDPSRQLDTPQQQAAFNQLIEAFQQEQGRTPTDGEKVAFLLPAVLGAPAALQALAGILPLAGGALWLASQQRQQQPPPGMSQAEWISSQLPTRETTQAASVSPATLAAQGAASLSPGADEAERLAKRYPGLASGSTVSSQAPNINALLQLTGPGYDFSGDPYAEQPAIQQSAPAAAPAGIRQAGLQTYNVPLDINAENLASKINVDVITANELINIVKTDPILSSIATVPAPGGGTTVDINYLSNINLNQLIRNARDIASQYSGGGQAAAGATPGSRDLVPGAGAVPGAGVGGMTGTGAVSGTATGTQTGIQTGAVPGAGTMAGAGTTTGTGSVAGTGSVVGTGAVPGTGATSIPGVATTTGTDALANAETMAGAVPGVNISEAATGVKPVSETKVTAAEGTANVDIPIAAPGSGVTDDQILSLIRGETITEPIVSTITGEEPPPEIPLIPVDVTPPSLEPDKPPTTTPDVPVVPEEPSSITPTTPDSEPPADVTPPGKTPEVEEPTVSKPAPEDVIPVSPTPPSPEPPPPPPPPSPPPPPAAPPPPPPPDVLFEPARRDKVLTEALTAFTPPVFQGRVGTAYSRPAGEIEAEVTGKKRRNVWNEASLRLRDALGL